MTEQAQMKLILLVHVNQAYQVSVTPVFDTFSTFCRLQPASDKVLLTVSETLLPIVGTDTLRKGLARCVDVT